MRIGDGWLARRWPTLAIFVGLAPLLFMLVDMTLEQGSQTEGASPGRLWNWIVEDSFFIPRTVYLLGILPAFLAGLIIARRDQRGGASLLFALVLFAAIGLAVGVFFARNLFLFTPPPFAEQLAICGRATLSVVISGLVCYALSRWPMRGTK